MEIEGDPQRFMAGELTGSLGDVDGEIAHSLQIVVDLHDTNHKAKIRGHGLVQGENLQALFLRSSLPADQW